MATSSSSSTSTAAIAQSSSSTSSSQSTSSLSSSPPHLVDEAAARLKAQRFNDAAARILHLQERDRLARSRESPQPTRSAAHAEFEAAAAILRLQEEHRLNRLQPVFPLMRLPQHVRAHVLSLLPASPVHLLRVRLVCRELCAITHWNVLWHQLALDQWGIVDPQQRPRRGETWQAYYIETHRMLRKSDETFMRAAVERGLVRVVRDNLDRAFCEQPVQHLCVAIQHSQPSIVQLLLPLAPPALLSGAPTSSIAVSPLRLAIRANRLEIVQCLLAAGASLDTPAILPPLHFAAQRGATPAMMQLLLQRSRSPDTVQIHAADGQTPLHHALAFGHVSCAEWLLARKANLEAVDSRGRTPLVAAVRAGSVPGVEFAFQRGATLPQMPLSDTRSLLHEAAANGHARIVELLVQNGADIESRDMMNNTPIFLAAFGGHAKVVQTLIQLDARIDVCNSDGCTPLHNAARCGSADCIKLLLRLGARTDVEDCDGRTPSEYARALGHQHVVRLIDAYASVSSASPALVSPRIARAIGLLGGNDFELTALYFRLINLEMRARACGGGSAPQVLVASSDWSSVPAAPAVAPSSPPALTRRSSSAVSAASPVLSPREIGVATRLRDAALLLMSAGADVLCVVDGNSPIDASASLDSIATSDERDAASPAEVNREGRVVVGRWSSLARTVRVAACRSVVIVDRLAEPQTGRWMLNAHEAIARCGVTDVATLCECAMTRLRALMLPQARGDGVALLRELFRELHVRFDAIVLLDHGVFEVWHVGEQTAAVHETPAATSCTHVCSSARCTVLGGGAPTVASKALVLDVTHTHIVAVCDAATLPSQQLSFQQNVRV